MPDSEMYWFILRYSPFVRTLLLTLGLFAATWFWRRNWFRHGVSRDTGTGLWRLGAAGAVLLCIVQGALGFWNALGFDLFGAYHDPHVMGWHRSATLIVTALVVASLAMTLHRSRRVTTQPPFTMVVPRRSWYHEISAWWLGVLSALTALIACIAVWQARTSGEVTELPIFGTDETQPTYGSLGAPPAAFGWISNILVLLALGALVAGVIWALHANSRIRTLGRTVRQAQALLVVLVTCSGLLFGVSAVFLHAWVPAEWIINIEPTPRTRHQFMGSHYDGLIDVLHQVSWYVQAVGIALLLRVAVDASRTARAQERQYGMGAVQAGRLTVEVSR